MKRALVIVDHGSRRPEAHRHLETLAEQVQSRAAELLVCAAHMELAEPSLEKAIDRCVEAGAEEVLVHPLFLAPGRHLAQDIPRLVEEAVARHPGLRVRITAALGERPELVELILASL